MLPEEDELRNDSVTGSLNLGVNLTNVLKAGFTRSDPKSAKKD